MIDRLGHQYRISSLWKMSTNINTPAETKVPEYVGYLLYLSKVPSYEDVTKILVEQNLFNGWTINCSLNKGEDHYNAAVMILSLVERNVVVRPAESGGKPVMLHRKSFEEMNKNEKIAAKKSFLFLNQSYIKKLPYCTFARQITVTGQIAAYFACREWLNTSYQLCLDGYGADRIRTIPIKKSEVTSNVALDKRRR